VSSEFGNKKDHKQSGLFKSRFLMKLGKDNANKHQPGKE
jgi:hypothetical protein